MVTPVRIFDANNKEDFDELVSIIMLCPEVPVYYKRKQKQIHFAVDLPNIWRRRASNYTLGAESKRIIKKPMHAYYYAIGEKPND